MRMSVQKTLVASFDVSTLIPRTAAGQKYTDQAELGVSKNIVERKRKFRNQNVFKLKAQVQI